MSINGTELSQQA